MAKLNPKQIRASRCDTGDQPIVVVLDMPPSTNHLFANIARGRALSEHYKKWRRKSAQEMLIQQPGRMAGPVRVLILLEDIHPRRDADNAIKPLLDFIASPEINLIDGDHATIVREVSAKWEQVTGARVVIERAVARPI